MIMMSDIQIRITEMTNPKQGFLQIYYYYNHICCPNCGSENGISTLAAYPLSDDSSKWKDYKDENESYCQCGFKHVYHDRVPRSK